MISKIKEATFQAVGNRSTSSIAETIVISGVPRSGTTWLLELLRTLPGRKAMNEPLMYEEARKKHGFSWRTYLDPAEDAPEQRAYLNTLLTGQLGITPAWYFEADTRPTQLLEHATRDQLVVKFCRLNRMLHWFCRQFDVRGPAFIVRHPCAVVASMLRHGSWDEDDLHGSKREDHALHANTLPDTLQDPFAPILNRIETQVEALTCIWCLDHYIPLVHQAKGSPPWILVPYERMVARGHEELQRVANALGVDVTSEMRAQLDEPSNSVKDQLHQEAEQQLSKWQRRLSTDQIDQILDIVSETGLDAAYSRDLEPNYEWLNKRQRPKWRW